MEKIHEDVLLEDETEVRHPSLYRVLLCNDDYTPMDFVVMILQKFFDMEFEAAARIMLMVHNKGMGECGVFPREIAETKVSLVTAFSRQHEHPLKCIMEKV